MRDRILVGVQCKRLIEYGRLEWVKEQGLCSAAEIVTYVEPQFSGENRLLVAAFS